MTQLTPNINSLSLNPSITQSQLDRINSLLTQSKAANTINAYQSDWDHFTQFCTSSNLTPLPASPETILLYISECSKTLKLSTIKRRLHSINKAHVTSNHPSPTKIKLVDDLLNGISRANGSKQTPKKALAIDDLKAIIDSIDIATLTGKRDKAMILVGFTTASRRSELVSINIQDITFTPEGMDIFIHDEKTHQYLTKSIIKTNNNYCPVSALQQWLDVSQIKMYAVFRSINKSNKIGERLNDKTVVRAIKHYASLSGLDPSVYAGHSLRSGFATSAAEAGYSAESIMRTTGHQTRQMVDRYIQVGNRYKSNPTEILKNM